MNTKRILVLAVPIFSVISAGISVFPHAVPSAMGLFFSSITVLCAFMVCIVVFRDGIFVDNKKRKNETQTVSGSDGVPFGEAVTTDESSVVMSGDLDGRIITELDVLREDIGRTSSALHQILECPDISTIFSSSTSAELLENSRSIQTRLTQAESAVSALTGRLLTDYLVMMPLANAVIRAVPAKTEEAAFTVMEKFTVVRSASSDAAANARKLRTEMEDTQSEKSVTFTAEKSRESVRKERDVVRELGFTIRQNREHLEAMSREIESGLELLSNITDITERSKLIAFNMSIEAARIGEKGRGFKVIIAELHKLNDRTFEVSRRVANLLSRFRDYNSLLVENMEEKAGAVISEVENGMDTAESAVEALIDASSRTQDFTREIALMSESIDHDLDGVLESLQFQDITRQMIEGAQAIMRRLEESAHTCAEQNENKIDRKQMREQFEREKARCISEAKTNGEKTALMEVRL